MANKCAAICRKIPGVEHHYDEHIAGVWDDNDPHTVWREQEEVPLVTVEMQEGGCMDTGNNKWWTKWLGVGSTQGKSGARSTTTTRRVTAAWAAVGQQAEWDQKPGCKNAGPSTHVDCAADH